MLAEETQKVWDILKGHPLLDGFVLVGGTVTSYMGIKRVSVESLAPVEASDPTDFLPGSERSLSEVSAAFRTLVNSVSDSRCRSVLKAVFGDKEFFERFCRAPGAQIHHHASRTR